jgi:hypothetical protein
LARLSRIMCEVLALHLKDGTRPRIPEAGFILWRCFADLCEERQNGPAGPDPILSGAVREWADLHKVPMQAHHVAVVRDLDRVWLAAARAKPEPLDLTPEGFDAVFG